MQDRHTLIKARLKTVRRDLDEAVSRTANEMLPWAPTPGMRTISGQFVEIISTEMQLVALLRDDKDISDEEARTIIGDCDDLQNLKDSLVRVRKDTLDYLDSLTESELSQEVEFGGGWFGSMGLPTIPRAEIFVSIADHEWYHVGQLTSYLWSRGINPYTG